MNEERNQQTDLGELARLAETTNQPQTPAEQSSITPIDEAKIAREIEISDAKELLESLGYTVEWDMHSYQFRDAVRAGDEAACQQLRDTIEEGIGNFGVEKLGAAFSDYDVIDSIYADTLEDYNSEETIKDDDDHERAVDEYARAKDEDEAAKEKAEDEEVEIERVPLPSVAIAKNQLEEALSQKIVFRLAVDRYGDLAGWRLPKEDMDEADIERMQEALLGSEPTFDVCWVRGGELTTATNDRMSIDDLPKAIAEAKAERIRFYTEREKEFGPSAWPGGSHPADLKIVSGGVA